MGSVRAFGGGAQLGGDKSEKAKQVHARSGSAANCASAACTIAGDAVTRKNTAIVRAVKGYDAVLADVVALIDAGRRGSIRTTNAIMTATYWGVGRRIVEGEQHGATRADYGDALISRLSQDLQAKFGRGGPEILAQHAADVGHEESERRVGLGLVAVGHYDSPELNAHIISHAYY